MSSASLSFYQIRNREKEEGEKKGIVTRENNRERLRNKIVEEGNERERERERGKKRIDLHYIELMYRCREKFSTYMVL